MAHIDLQKYFVEKKEHETGRPRYDREKLLKIVLFAFMEFGYCSVRFIQKLCEADIRFLWLLDKAEAPSHTKINDFIKYELAFSLEEIFDDINCYRVCGIYSKYFLGSYRNNQRRLCSRKRF